MPVRRLLAAAVSTLVLGATLAAAPAALADAPADHGTPQTATSVTSLPYDFSEPTAPVDGGSRVPIRRDDASNAAVARACNGGVAVDSPAWWKVAPPAGARVSARAALILWDFRWYYADPTPMALVAADGVTVLACSTVATSAAQLAPHAIAAGQSVYVVRWYPTFDEQPFARADLRIVDAPSGPPSNDLWQNATTVGDLPFTSTVDTTLATYQGGESPGDYAPYECAGFDPSTSQPAVWFSYTPTETQRVTFDVSGSGYPAEVFVVRRGPAGPTGTSLNYDDDSDVATDCNPTDLLQAGVPYLVGVSAESIHNTPGFVNNGGLLRFSAKRVLTAPAVPVAPVARSGAGVGQVSLSWTAPVSRDTPITGYRVYGGTSPTQLSLIASPGASTLSGTYTYPDQAALRYFSVAAVNVAGESGQSPVVSAAPRVGSSVYVDDAWIREGSTGSATGTFAVKLSSPSTIPVSLTYATADRVGRAGSDYAAIPATRLTFAPGETVKTITATVLGDTRKESLEQFALDLSAVAGAVLADTSATGFIVDEEGPKSVRISDAHTTEGAGSTKALTFSVALSQAAEAGAPVTVAYATANSTASSTSDYVASSGTVTFNAGESAKTVTVTVKGDTTVEPNESFAVNLSSLTGDGAVLADSAATGTIVNDDGTAGATPAPTLSIADTSALEGASGTRVVTVPVTLSRTRTSAVTATYSIVAGTASAGSDFTAATGTLTIAAGATTANVPVTVVGDARNEGLIESLTVRLSAPSGATLADAAATLTLVDEEGPIFAYPSDTRVVEGNTGTRSMVYTLSLSAPPAAGQTVNVKYTLTGGTATTTDADHAALTPGTLTFAAGQRSGTVSVLVNGDTRHESDETVLLTWSSPTGLVLADPTGTGRITSDD